MQGIAWGAAALVHQQQQPQVNHFPAGSADANGALGDESFELLGAGAKVVTPCPVEHGAYNRILQQWVGNGQPKPQAVAKSQHSQQVTSFDSALEGEEGQQGGRPPPAPEPGQCQ